MKMMSLDELKQEAFKNPHFKKEYDALEDEFQFIATLLTMRQKAGLTQDLLAEKMGTTKRSIIRLESGSGNPGWKTLQKYAHACGFKIQLQYTH